MSSMVGYAGPRHIGRTVRPAAPIPLRRARGPLGARGPLTVYAYTAIFARHGRRRWTARGARRPLAPALRAPARPPAGARLAGDHRARRPPRLVPVRHRGRPRRPRAAAVRLPRRRGRAVRGADGRLRRAARARARVGWRRAAAARGPAPRRRAPG